MVAHVADARLRQDAGVQPQRCTGHRRRRTHHPEPTPGREAALRGASARRGACVRCTHRHRRWGLQASTRHITDCAWCLRVYVTFFLHKTRGLCSSDLLSLCGREKDNPSEP